jgi:hypothetical protein
MRVPWQVTLHNFGELVCKHIDEFGENLEGLFDDKEKALQIERLMFAQRIEK